MTSLVDVYSFGCILNEIFGEKPSWFDYHYTTIQEVGERGVCDVVRQVGDWRSPADDSADGAERWGCGAMMR